MTDVITELTKVFDGLKDGTISPDVATELNNTCGKIINASKVQLMYAALRQEKPSIQFLEDPSARSKSDQEMFATINLNPEFSVDSVHKNFTQAVGRSKKIDKRG